jgi:hypothetical protein
VRSLKLMAAKTRLKLMAAETCCSRKLHTSSLTGAPQHRETTSISPRLAGVGRLALVRQHVY